ncbi:MAG: hypothetical protein GC159_15750 [Phycisphaera sp.]|nr:hypothetical protein [Phycisphaera sp.]
MTNHTPRRILLATLLLAVVGLTTAADACQIPVFRYALERWQPDAFDTYIVHRGPLSEQHRAMVKRLTDAATSEDKPLNIVMHDVDLDNNQDKLAAELLKVFGEPTGELPQLWMEYPRHVDTDRMAYRGPLTDEVVEGLLDSPARREVIRRIIGGDSAVWLLLESGDKAKDDAAEDTLKKNIEVMKTQIELPTIADLKKDEFYRSETKVDLKLEFTILRIKNDDPAEQMFIQTLINAEPGLFKYYKNEAMAIPVFGRGRSYYALVGRGIQTQTIAESCAFVAGACSCQVKEQNPGADLLLAANWDKLVVGSAKPEAPLPELPTSSNAAPADAGAATAALSSNDQSGHKPDEVAVASVDVPTPAVPEASVTLPDMHVTAAPPKEGLPTMWLVIGGAVLVVVLVAAIGTVAKGMGKQEA